MSTQDAAKEEFVEIDVEELKKILAAVDRVTIPKNLREKISAQKDPSKVKIDVALNFRSNIAWQ